VDSIFAPIETPRLRLEPVSTEQAQAILAGDLSGLTAGRGWPHSDTAHGLRMALLRGHPPGWLILLCGIAGDPGTATGAGDRGAATGAGNPRDATDAGNPRKAAAAGALRDLRDAGDIVIGDCGTHGPADADGSIEIGYGLAPRYRGQGFGTELVAALTRWLLAQPGIRRVLARTHVANLPSRRVLEKAGFRQVSLTGAEIVLVAGG